MVTSSPEYSITKPGLHHLRKREKSLKTYGKRTTSTPELRDEPPAKKVRVADADPTPRRPSTAEIKLDGSASSSPVKSDAETRSETSDAVVKKGSILCYFKPKPVSAPAPAPILIPEKEPETVSETVSEEAETTTPTDVRRKRKPRLLKIRAVTHSTDDLTDASDESTPTYGDRPRRQDRSSSEDTRTGSEADKGSTPTGEAQRPRRGRLAKAKSSPAVQTTLNISAQAPFSECKICDTVWNPLYPDDVKYHTKQHKAVLKAQAKKSDDL